MLLSFTSNNNGFLIGQSKLNTINTVIFSSLLMNSTNGRREFFFKKRKRKEENVMVP